MNRSIHRLMRANAETLAGAMAKTSMDYDREGRLIRVRDARALDVLRRAFAAMLRQGGEPVVMPITFEAASGFPRSETVPDHMAGCTRPWLAVGMDRRGAATYAMRYIGIVGVSGEEARDLAEVKMLAELARETNLSGFPVSTGGRA